MSGESIDPPSLSTPIKTRGGHNHSPLKDDGVFKSIFFFLYLLGRLNFPSFHRYPKKWGGYAERGKGLSFLTLKVMQSRNAGFFDTNVVKPEWRVCSGKREVALL